MHTVKVNLIADQSIYIFGKDVNVHDIVSIRLDHEGKIDGYSVGDEEEVFGTRWVYRKDTQEHKNELMNNRLRRVSSASRTS
jgi:hypothetical protein